MATLFEKLVPTLTAAVCLSQLSSTVMAQSAYNYNTYSAGGSTGGAYAAASYGAGQPAYRGHLSYVPAGIVFPITLSTAIAGDMARPGDLVQGTLSQPVNLGNGLIPAGTKVIGQITDAKSGGFLGRSGMLQVQFNRLRGSDGMEYPMASHIIGGIARYSQAGTSSNTFQGETMKNKAGQAAVRGAVGAGAGAALGTAIGAIAGHGRGAGRGAWSGAAIGGGLGLADSLLLRKGGNVNIASGTPIQLQLDSPMNISLTGPSTGTF